MAAAAVSQRLEISVAVWFYRLLSTVQVPARWLMAVALIILALAVPLPPRAEPVGTLQLREQMGQLLICWPPVQNARLEILDGGLHTSLPVSRELVSVTYTRQSREVEIRLIDRGGKVAARTGRFLSSSTPHDIAGLSQRMTELRTRAHELRNDADVGGSRLQDLQTIADRLLQRISMLRTPHPVKGKTGT